MNTCAHVCTQLTHALNRKFLILTKPKCKIYKTKSLCNYITLVRVPQSPSAKLSLSDPWEFGLLKYICIHDTFSLFSSIVRGSFRCLMAKAQNYSLEVNDFERQSLYQFHFGSNTLGICMKPSILQVMG